MQPTTEELDNIYNNKTINKTTMAEEQNQNPLKNETIEITGVELVTKGKEPNTWKEYDVRIKNYVKGTKYCLPIKKKDQTETKAYQFFMANFAEWNQKFASDETVMVSVAISEKVNNWEFEGNTGTTTYKTIRFMEEPSDVDQEIANRAKAEDETEIDVENAGL